MAKAIVTGGAGFLGSHLVDTLIARGDDVLVLDNLSTGRIGNLEAAVTSGKATFVFADVALPAAGLRAIVQRAGWERADLIFHLASPASPDAYLSDPWGTLAVNGLGTMSLIELALDWSCRFVFASTSEIYGDPLEHPQPETYFGNVDPIGPRSCYDEGKRFGEAAVAAAVRSRALDARIVRFFNCYGPRMQPADGRLVMAMLQAACNGTPFPIHGTGLQTRSMTFCDDAVELLLLVERSSFKTLQPVNIGNDDERTVEDVARTIANVVGVSFVPVHVDAREGDPQRRRPDLRVAKSLGWSPRTTLEDGLRRTYAHFAKSKLAAV